MKRIAFQGELGAYSELATYEYFNRNVKVVPKPLFRDVFKAVEKGDADHGIIPIENSLAGSILENYDLLIESLKKTGKVLLASDACERNTFLHNVASNLTQLAFNYLDGPPVAVGSRNWITPAAEMEELFFPQKEWILDTIHERVYPLPGHQVATVQTYGEILRRSRLGV